VSHRLTNLYKPLREKERKRKKGDRERERESALSLKVSGISETHAQKKRKRKQRNISTQRTTEIKQVNVFQVAEENHKLQLFLLLTALNS